jgi:hypothetical protein
LFSNCKRRNNKTEDISDKLEVRRKSIGECRKVSVNGIEVRMHHQVKGV